METYNKLKDGLKDYNTEDMLSEATIKKFVERYTKLDNKGATTEASILDAIAKLNEMLASDVSQSELRDINLSKAL